MTTLYREFSTQAELDAQYNAGASVDDYPGYMARWASDSAATRAALPCTLNIPYGATKAETLDIFPAEQPNAPVLVFVHGGYWRFLAASDFSFVAEGPRQHGFTTVVVNYDLCPWVSIDEIVRQTRASLAWVYRHIAAYGGDPERIAVSGHSAGGQLTGMSMFTPWSERYGLPDNLVKAAVPISGLFDLRPLRYTYLQPALQLDSGVIERNSPHFLVRRIAAPTLVAWGDQESSEFARQSRDFAQALSGTGASVDLHASAGKHHFSVLDEFKEPASPICLWLKQAISRLSAS